MSHDHLAELQGYRNELANAERAGNDDQAADVRAEIARVTTAIGRRAELLAAEADQHEVEGRYERAARARAAAKEHADAFAELEDTSDQTPSEQAVPRRGRPSGK